MHALLPLWDDANPVEKLEKLRAMMLELYAGHFGPALQTVMAQLTAHTASDDKERADVAMILAACRTHPNLMRASCEFGHLTGSALIVDPVNRRVLLNHHRGLNRWLQFGGHFDDETEPWRVALREGGEETGLHDLRFFPGPEPALLDVDAHRIPAAKGRPEHWHFDLRYLLATYAPDQATVTTESHEIRWLTFEDAHAMPVDASLRRLLTKAAQLMRQSPA
jgi:8-oxo-dGTP pyrophosphatase MutT (NUDIX family)